MCRHPSTSQVSDSFRFAACSLSPAQTDPVIIETRILRNICSGTSFTGDFLALNKLRVVRRSEVMLICVISLRLLFAPLTSALRSARIFWRIVSSRKFFTAFLETCKISISGPFGGRMVSFCCCRSTSRKIPASPVASTKALAGLGAGVPSLSPLLASLTSSEKKKAFRFALLLSILRTFNTVSAMPAPHGSSCAAFLINETTTSGHFMRRCLPTVEVIIDVRNCLILLSAGRVQRLHASSLGIATVLHAFCCSAWGTSLFKICLAPLIACAVRLCERKVFPCRVVVTTSPTNTSRLTSFGCLSPILTVLHHSLLSAVVAISVNFTVLVRWPARTS